MKKVLLTGMSGTGKSTLVAELRRRGFQAVDLGEPNWSYATADGDWQWREDRVSELFAGHDDGWLFVSGCAQNQVRFHEDLDTIVLLSAPTDVLLHRLAVRTNNDYGKRPEEIADVLEYIDSVEPRLRRVAHHEIDTDAPLDDVVDELLSLVGATQGP